MDFQALKTKNQYFNLFIILIIKFIRFNYFNHNMILKINLKDLFLK
jgi:hypothetical protein